MSASQNGNGKSTNYPLAIRELEIRMTHDILSLVDDGKLKKVTDSLGTTASHEIHGARIAFCWLLGHGDEFGTKVESLYAAAKELGYDLKLKSGDDVE